MSVDFTVSVIGYKADDKAENGYISETFSTVIQVEPSTIKKLEAGAPLPDQYKPKLPKGYFDSPKEATKKDTYEFKPAKDLGGIKVVSE